METEVAKEHGHEYNLCLNANVEDMFGNVSIKQLYYRCIKESPLCTDLATADLKCYRFMFCLFCLLFIFIFSFIFYVLFSFCMLLSSFSCLQTLILDNDFNLIYFLLIVTFVLCLIF